MSLEPTLKQAHIFVSGRVQGVYYRQSTKERALALGIQGWTRNLADKRVEIVAQGSQEQLDALIQWCELGPDLAKVERVEVAFEAPSSAHEGFRIIR